MVQKINHVTLWRLDHRQPSDGNCLFGRAFQSFGPSIRGFAHYRLVVSINGTHLYGKYEDRALIAKTTDANNGIHPLALAICEGENGGSQRWFLHNLRQYVTCNRKVCFMSYRFSEFQKIVAEIHPPRQGHAHRLCLRHIKANINKCFKNESLLYKFYATGSASTSTEEYKLKEELDALDHDAWKWADDLEKHRVLDMDI